MCTKTHTASHPKMEDMRLISSYKTVEKEFAEASFTEKKSEFIGCAARVETEEAAKSFIERIRRKHSDATHNCYAYLLKDSGLSRFSDDGEPGGTAGMPILEVVKREGVCDVCIVVTRYFGGILLGAGGLVRAYAKGAKMALDAAGTATFVPYTAFTTQVDYTGYEKVMHELAKYGVVCDGTEFAAEVTLKLRAKEENFVRFQSFLADYTSGRSICTVTGSAFGKEN